MNNTRADHRSWPGGEYLDFLERTRAGFCGRTAQPAASSTTAGKVDSP